MAVVALAPAGFGAPAASGATTPRGAALSGLQVLSAAFATSSHGYLAGEVCRARCTGLVLASTDGGRTWRRVLRSAHPVDALAVLGRRDVWAVTGRLVRSRDGGRRWQALAAGVGAVAFASARVGWGDAPAQDRSAPLSRRLVATADGGRTWRPLSRPCGPNALTAVQWLGARRLAVLCATQPAAGRQGKAIRRSSDGGRTWRTVLDVPFAARAAVGGLGAMGYPTGMAILPDGAGLLWEARGGFFRTGDGGRLWHALSLAAPDRREVRAASFATARVVYAVLDDLGRGRWSLVRSADGGSSWRTVRTWRAP